MSKRKRLTAAMIDHVWSLHNQGYSYSSIAAKLNISNTSVQRCIVALQIASNGELVRYEGLLKDSHYIADYANQKFGTFKTVEVEKESETDLAAAVDRLANIITRQTILLESFVKKLER